MKKVDGKKTISDLNRQIRQKNKEAWQADQKNVKARLRGNCWTVFKRLVYDMRNHFGDRERAKKRQMPYVDSEGWLHTSPALIAHAEGKSMDNSTVSRWLESLRIDEDKMLGEKPFILAQITISHKEIKLQLNMGFFHFLDVEPIPDTPTEKPPSQPGGHIDLSKLRTRFNRKHHIR